MEQLRKEVAMLHAEVNELRQLLSAGPAVLTNDSEFPALAGNSINSAGDAAVGKASFVSLAKDLSDDNTAFNLVAKKSTKRRPPLFGASSTNSWIKSVSTSRQVDIFVSRLDPNTHEQCLRECVDEIKGDVKVVDVKCNKLKSN